MCNLTTQDLPPITSTPNTTSEPPSCIPSDPFSHLAYKHAQTHLQPLILSHSIRVYLYATHLNSLPPSSTPTLHPTAGAPVFDRTATSPERIFLASIFHDIGTSAQHDHNQRFEVCGADAAVQFCQAHGLDAIAAQRDIWTAIALHTSPGIAERMGALTKLLRMAVKADFGDVGWRELLGEEVIKDAESRFPRGEIEKVLGDAVAEQGVRLPVKAPRGSWPGNLLRAKLEEPEWEGVNKGF